MKFDVLVFIGRFAPFHKGHEGVVRLALSQSKKVAMVLGSDQQPRTARNPFTTAERIKMITGVFPEEVAAGRIVFCPQVDHTYNMDRWIAGIQSSASAVANTPFTPDPVRIGLIGHSKDHSSFYLKSFPTWETVEAPNYNNVNATAIRKDMFETEDWLDRWEAFLPPYVAAFMQEWEQGAAFKDVLSEHMFLEEYKRQFIRPSNSEIDVWLEDNDVDPGMLGKFLSFADNFCPKFPPAFYTVDSVVVQSGHILLVKRGGMPGKGLWALPGGFVNKGEDSKDAAVRELREETRLAVPEPVLRGSIRSWRTFDDPHRSQRGRTVTVAYYFDLRPQDDLPKVKGSDDAEKAKWVPLSNLRRDALFEDHYDIIEKMVGI